ncbi:MAG: dihydrodipicolinate synthase family protein [Planctomycetaceae bacterium]
MAAGGSACGVDSDQSSGLARLTHGVCIPAHPLALDQHRRLDERRQRALTRYYLHAGAGGLAVGVHTTQFEIRQPQHALLRPVLELAAETARSWDRQEARAGRPSTLLIAGICGPTAQAVDEAVLAKELGYHAGLLSLGALAKANERELLEHCRTVAGVLPVIGFYLQPAVGGRQLPYRFWRQFADIPQVVAIKVAPFNRYQTLDVVRAVAESDRWREITLLTGNDDAIVHDLLSSYVFEIGGQERRLHFAGGLLGHWACWTRCAVALRERCQALREGTASATAADWADMLTIGNQVTDMNAAIFDAAHSYRGCIAGVHEVLRRQGLLAGNWCLDPSEQLSAGQAEEISRVCDHYPHLVDDEFVRENLDRWLGT